MTVPPEHPWLPPDEAVDAADLQAVAHLDARGAMKVMRMLRESPGPNEAMLRLFGAMDSPCRSRRR